MFCFSFLEVCRQGNSFPSISSLASSVGKQNLQGKHFGSSRTGKWIMIYKEKIYLFKRLLCLALIKTNTELKIVSSFNFLNPFIVSADNTISSPGNDAWAADLLQLLYLGVFICGVHKHVYFCYIRPGTGRCFTQTHGHYCPDIMV